MPITFHIQYLWLKKAGKNCNSLYYFCYFWCYRSSKLWMSSDCTLSSLEVRGKHWHYLTHRLKFDVLLAHSWPLRWVRAILLQVSANQQGRGAAFVWVVPSCCPWHSGHYRILESLRFIARMGILLSLLFSFGFSLGKGKLWTETLQFNCFSLSQRIVFNIYF